jgi:hypothetical protein
VSLGRLGLDLLDNRFDQRLKLGIPVELRLLVPFPDAWLSKRRLDSALGTLIVGRVMVECEVTSVSDVCRAEAVAEQSAESEFLSGIEFRVAPATASKDVREIGTRNDEVPEPIPGVTLARSLPCAP